MAAVTQTIPTYLGGVSRQIDSKKKAGQVRECNNTLPDPTFGLRKRPGTKFIKTLTTSSLDKAKWFYIHRDGDEQYIGRVSTGSPGNVAVWNAITGNVCTIHYDALAWVASTAYTVGDKVTNDSGKVYVCDTAGTSDSSGGPTGTGTDITDNTARWDYVSGPTAQNYLQPATDFTDNPTKNYDILTVQDTTIVTNKTTKITVETEPTYVGNKKATIRILNVRYGSRYRVKIDSSETADYITQMEDASGATEVLNTGDVLDQLVTNIKALSGWSDSDSGTTVTKLTSSIELESDTAFTIETTDDQGGKNLTVYQEQVNNVPDLPDEAMHGRLVKIMNTAKDEKSAYWAQFKAEDGTSGRGFWEETIDPTVSVGLNNTTMPHELYNNDTDSFIFREIDWKDRVVGDDKTNEQPSFVDKTIQQTFLYNSRLGFLTEDNVSISRAQDYYNFYFTSALTLTADDPIDLSCSSVRPAVLHGVIPTAQGLTLFSKNQQFMMFAEDGILTPDTAIIRSISNYEMDTDIDPVDIGTNINFVSKTPSYSRIFGMQTRGLEQNPVIQDISRAVSEWIPDEIDNLFSSPQNSITGVYSSDDKFIYMYRVYTLGQEEVMQAWFKWELPGKVQFCTIDNDIMWLVIENGTTYTLLKVNVSKSTTDDIITTSDGQQVNPHMDMYTAATNGAAGASEKKVVYDPTDDLSKCYIPYTDLTDLTPVILIKGTGVTDSGFTINPGRGSDDDGTYFTIPRKNFESEAANVYVGYQYNYDVELPKTYFRKNDNTTDYTANLTIARMKFAVGLSSVVGFKVKSKGYRGDLWEGTVADAKSGTSGKSYEVPFLLKEENGIKVTLDGARQVFNTDYTVTSTDTQSTVTFTTAPTGETTVANKVTPAQKIAITTDTWYDVQPVQEAGQYLADDVPLVEENVFTVPIHQRSENFSLRVFSNSPFPVSLNSMMWEGNYSPRFYRRN